MQTIETMITVLSDGSFQIPPRPDLGPGQYHAVLVIEQATPTQGSGASEPKPLLNLKMVELPGWPTDARFRREDLYNDE